MNLFWLLDHPRRAVRLYGHKHVNKMLLQATQLMSNAYHHHGAKGPYRPTHMRHPWSLWAARRRRHFRLLGAFAVALCLEYTSRRKRVHGCQKHVLFMLRHPPPICRKTRPEHLATTKFARAGRERVPLCMPEQFHHPVASVAYRRYYANKMTSLMRKAPWRQHYGGYAGRFVALCAMAN